MGIGRATHHFGTVLLFAAVGLLIVADVTAPVVNDLALFRVNLGDSNNLGSSITFGTFGYCIRNYLGGDDNCSGTNIGYNIASVLEDNISNIDFSSTTRDAAQTLTYVFVLHPVATGLAFLAALFSLLDGVVGGLITTAVAAVAFLATAIVVICEFVCFSLLRREVDDVDDASGDYEAGILCALIAAIWCLVATVIAFLTCCAGRSKSNGRSRKSYDKNHWLHGEPAPYVQSAPAV